MYEVIGDTAYDFVRWTSYESECQWGVSDRSGTRYVALDLDKTYCSRFRDIEHPLAGFK